ncbi:MAG: hypothetical protein AABX51_07050 [Nanoarchaeota archaeon]
MIENKHVISLLGFILVLSGCSNVLITPSSSCSDSDGGFNINVQGTSSTPVQSQTDTCDSLTTLSEYDCGNNNIVLKTIICTGGCLNGACQQ